MADPNTLPFFVTIPHSGEKVPEFCDWLQNLPEEILMCDVDRYVDVLYMPALSRLQIPVVKTEWHRYAADLNRIPEDVDAASVVGHKNPAGMHNRGFHWEITTLEQPLMKQPMTEKMHQDLVKLIYDPFHQAVRDQYQKFELGKLHPDAKIFHLDAHSMPSLGTKQHRDPGEKRAEIVVSDCKGQSASSEYVDLVIAAYSRAGFKVAYNWPYFGGRVSEQYGEPRIGHHALQVEMNRALYMNEQSKKLNPKDAEAIQHKVQTALQYIVQHLPALV